MRLYPLGGLAQVVALHNPPWILGYFLVERYFTRSLCSLDNSFDAMPYLMW